MSNAPASMTAREAQYQAACASDPEPKYHGKEQFDENGFIKKGWTEADGNKKRLWRGAWEQWRARQAIREEFRAGRIDRM